MAIFGVKIDYNKKIEEVVKEFNERLNGKGQNPALVFFQGKATLIIKKVDSFVFFNVRVNPFEPPLYKYVLYSMFKRALKKKGLLLTKTKLLDNKELSKLLELRI